MSIEHIGFAFLGTAMAALGISLLVFWVWMLVDCLRHESTQGKDRLVWALVIIFTKIIGAAIYYFVRYRHRGRLEIAEGTA